MSQLQFFPETREDSEHHLHTLPLTHSRPLGSLRNGLVNKYGALTFVSTAPGTHPMKAWLWLPAGHGFTGLMGEQQTKNHYVTRYHPRAQRRGSRQKCPFFLWNRCICLLSKRLSVDLASNKPESTCLLKTCPLGHWRVWGKWQDKKKIAFQDNYKGLRDNQDLGQCWTIMYVPKGTTPLRLGEVAVLPNT